MTNETIVPEEFQLIKSQVTIVQEMANELSVENIDDLTIATDILHQVKEVKKLVKESKEEITRPMMKALSNVRDLFRPLELGYADAEKCIKAKMLSFQIEEDDRITKEKAKLAARVEKGTMRPDTAAMKMEEVGDAPTKVAGSVGKSTVRKIKKVRIVDEDLIPREYMVVDMKAVTEAILRKGEVVPGAEMYEERSIVSR